MFNQYNVLCLQITSYFTDRYNKKVFLLNLSDSITQFRIDYMIEIPNRSCRIN